MGWTFRKGFGLFGNLLRLNVSKSGLSTSLGLKNLRLNISSRGAMVSTGWGPFRYVKYLGGKKRGK